MRVVGVDLGIKKVAVSYVENGVLTGTEAYESHALERTTQLMDIGDYVYSEVKYYRPTYVFIESTIIGNNRKYSIRLAETMGSVLAHLGLLQTEEDLDVVPVNNKAWKLKTIGNGNATKTAVQDYIDGIRGAYAGLCGGDQDRYDAAAIGLYGWTIQHEATEYLVENL
jgi:Holliday junction resolvasome RuvABC endonuclease subunit